MIMGINTCYFLGGLLLLSAIIKSLPFFFFKYIFNFSSLAKSGSAFKMTFLHGCPAMVVVYRTHRVIFGVMTMQTIHRTNN